MYNTHILSCCMIFACLSQHEHKIILLTILMRCVGRMAKTGRIGFKFNHVRHSRVWFQTPFSILTAFPESKYSSSEIRSSDPKSNTVHILQIPIPLFNGLSTKSKLNPTQDSRSDSIFKQFAHLCYIPVGHLVPSLYQIIPLLCSPFLLSPLISVNKLWHSVGCQGKFLLLSYLTSNHGYPFIPRLLA